MCYLTRLSLAILVGFISLNGPRASGSEHWTEFRGSQGTGQSSSATPPTTWSESSHVVWKTPIRGKGWSSPVVWGNQIWITTASEDGREMFAVCVDLTSGELQHEVLVFENAEPRFCHPTNSYASPTPVVEEGRVYVHFGSYGTACLNAHNGQILWQRRDFVCDHFRGPGASPILHGGRLFVAFDGFDVQYVVALDKTTGTTLWQRDREIDYGSDNGDFRKAYGTAQVAPCEGGEQLISPSAAETISYDPATGDERWRLRHGGMNTATRPVVAAGNVLITTGDAIGQKKPALIAIPLDSAGRLDESQASWSLTSGTPKRSSPVAVGNLVFVVTDDGIASCLDATSGAVHWRTRLGGNFRASPVAADGHLYFFNLEGEGIVLRDGDTYERLAKNRLDHGCQASPALVGNALIVRTTAHLYRLEEPSSPAGESGRTVR